MQLLEAALARTGMQPIDASELEAELQLDLPLEPEADGS